MALQLPYTTPSGYTFPRAYIKINYTDTVDGLLLFVADVYASPELRESGHGRIDSFVNMAPDNGNPDKVAAIYEWLKTTPGFESAVDI